MRRMPGKYGLVVVGTLLVILGAAVRFQGEYHHGVDSRPATPDSTRERSGFDRLTVA